MQTLADRERLGIWANAALWTAGHSLTSGAFLSYFAVDLGASAFVLALLAALPELVGVSGLSSRWVWRLFGRRKRAWLVTTLVARLFTLFVPLAGLPAVSASGVGSPWTLVGLVGVSQLCQGIATTLYFAWLADLAPPSGWGRLFAGRNMASLVIQLIVPIFGALLRDRWKQTLPTEELWQPYAVVFSIGVALLIASVLPMWAIRDPIIAPPTRDPASRSLTGILRHRGVRRLLAHSWCLAAANGLTQAAFFKFQIGIVGLSLTGYFVLADLMYGLQLVGSWWAGRCRSAADHRCVLFWSTLITSCSIPFYMLASREQWWWLIGAFACWGAFGAVNVAGPNLMFSFAKPGDSTHELALFRQVAGTIAGLSGLLGGWALDRLIEHFRGSDAKALPLSAFLILFAISGAGRVTAALLVLRVPVDDVS